MSDCANTSHKAGEIPIPKSFFSQLLPAIDNANELRLILYILYLIHQKKSTPRLITYRELLRNAIIMSITQKMEGTTSETLNHALETALKEGVLLHLGKWLNTNLVWTIIQCSTKLLLIMRVDV